MTRFDDEGNLMPGLSSGSAFSWNSALDSISQIGQGYLGYKLASQQIKAQTPEGRTYSEGQPTVASAPLFNIPPMLLLLGGVAVLVLALKG